jgi:hypothetical protein
MVDIRHDEHPAHDRHYIGTRRQEPNSIGESRKFETLLNVLKQMMKHPCHHAKVRKMRKRLPERLPLPFSVRFVVEYFAYPA